MSIRPPPHLEDEQTRVIYQPLYFMATKKINKYAAQCEEAMLAGGRITTESSARPLLYDISRHWRRLLKATGHISDNLSNWSEREEVASEILITALAYLNRIGCKDIEDLLIDKLNHISRKNK